MKYCLLSVSISLALLFGACSGKELATPTPKTLIELAAYSAALDECRAIGKDAGSYSVYEKCAKNADDKFGRDAGK